MTVKSDTVFIKQFWIFLVLLLAFTIIASIFMKWPNQIFLFGAIIISIIGIFAPRYLFLAILVFLPFSFERDIYFIHGLNMAIPTELLMLLVIIFFVFGIFTRGKFTWYHSPLNLAVCIYVFIMIISAIGTNHPMVSVKTTSRSLAYILVGFGITRYMIIDKRLLKNVLIAMFFMGVCLVFYGFYTQINAGVAVYQDIALPFFKNHCIYAEYLCIIFAILLAFTLGFGKIKGRTLLVSGSILFACAILMTFVRGAWLAVFVLLSYAIVIQGRKAPFKLIAILLVLMIAAAGFALTMDLTELLTQRINRLTDFRYVTNFDRIDRWMAAFSMFLHHPVLGVGYGNYPEEYYQYIWFIKATTLTDRMGAHNLYLEILAETGFLGLIAFLGLVVTFFRESFKLLKELNDSFWLSLTAGVVGAMITYLVHGVVNNLGPSDKLELLFWILIGMPILIRKLGTDKIVPS